MFARFSISRGNSSRAVAASVAGVLVLASVLVAAPAQAATSDDITYALDSATHTATVTGYTGSATAVEIPASVSDGVTTYAVTAIGSEAFYYKGLTSVDIPASVTVIGEGAFYGNGMTSVTLHEGLTEIGGWAFQTNSLVSVDIPASVTTIGEGAFYLNVLTSVTLPEGLKKIGDWAFQDNSLDSVEIPASVTTIGESAFFGNLLTSVTLHKGLKEIGISAFESNSLTSVDIPESVISIGESAFGANQLTAVTLREGLKEIGGWAFYDSSVVSVEIPASVTTIGAGAFDGNDLESAFFAGAAPTLSTDYPSLGDPAGLTVHYLADFGADTVVGGFTSPTWMEYASVIDPVVSFALNGHGAAVDSQWLIAGAVAVAPVPVPSASGWVFGGWFSDAGLTTAFDFAVVPTSDVTVFAKWTAAVVPPVDTTVTPVAAAVTLDLGLAVGEAVVGSTVTVSGVGLRSGSAYTVVVRSTPTTIAFGSVGADGTFTGTGVMPAGLAAGAHTVTLIGTAADGSAVSSIVYFTVDAAGIVTYLSSVEAAVVKTSALAATGFAGAPLGFAALLVLLAGAALVVGRRRVAAEGIRA